MASNQVSNRRKPTGASQGTQANQGNQGQQTRRPASVIANESDRDYGSLGDVAGQASEYWSRGEEQLREIVRGREATAVLIAMAAGLGVGLVLGASLGRPHIRQRSWRERMTAEGFGRRLMDRIESMIPEALSDHFAK